MTDAPSRQDTPENEDGHPSDQTPGTGTQQTGQRTQEVPQWASDQPAPAPWYLGQPGVLPPAPPMPPMPPPTVDQASWPNHAPGMRPEAGPGAGTGAGNGSGEPSDAVPGQQGGQSQQGRPTQPPTDQVPPVAPGAPVPPVPPWTGQAPPNPERPSAGPGTVQPAPWHDPNRYAQPGGRPPQQNQRPPYGPPQPKREEPGERPPLSLRTRWARGLAIGGAVCTLITLRYGYQDFPAWLIGAAVALALSMGGLWCGVFAQREAARRSQRAPEAVASVVWSSISTLIAVGVVAISLAFYPQLRAYSDCMRAAVTIAGQNTCQQQLDNSMTFKP